MVIAWIVLAAWLLVLPAAAFALSALAARRVGLERGLDVPVVPRLPRASAPMRRPCELRRRRGSLARVEALRATAGRSLHA